ncbi:YqkE family protein [Paenibacillus filicis]|uniref:YqkE family protein n=1 Tax=Paenibacillus gyeongsangnamensis TaxID=3388067 RepID=A0ABT4Q5V9_9BACL|nr:YqkE family protein [Paenibacillus filicis]MCZ8512250.1 YqkE family protein [Paenibacillus filicis]
MAKRKPSPAPESGGQEKAATLKDLLSAEVVQQLKRQADQMKAEEQASRERQRKQAEELRKAEQKRLEQDFEHLLNNSTQDWRKFK